MLEESLEKRRLRMRPVGGDVNETIRTLLIVTTLIRIPLTRNLQVVAMILRFQLETTITQAVIPETQVRHDSYGRGVTYILFMVGFASMCACHSLFSLCGCL